MKKLVIAFALLISTSAVYAQTQTAQPAQKPMAAPPQRMAPKTPEERAKMQTERMEKMLNLSKDQSSKINEVNMGTNKKMDAMRQPGNKPNREAFMEVMKSRDEQYKKIMTADQYAKYEQTMKPQPRPANAPSTAPAGNVAPVQK